MLKSNRIGVPALAAAAFAIALQIQVTLFQTADYEGLRVSLADFFVPVAGIVILGSLLLKKTGWPEWKKPFSYWFIVAMTAVMCFAMTNGYFIQGSLSQWALVNKFAGWFILMAYLGAGAWLAGNYRDQSIPVFIKFFTGFFIFAAGLEVGDQFFRAFGIILSTRYDWELIRGFMDNRNAFAFLFSCVAGFITLYGFKRQYISGHVLVMFWVLFPLVFLFNGSRTLWICTAMLFGIFAAFDWRQTLKIILPSILIGTALFFAVCSEKQKQYFSLVPYTSMNRLYNYSQAPEDPRAKRWAEITGDFGRLEIAKGAFELIKQYPLQGAGLGSVTYFQKKNGAATVNIIDNTGLWLLTEIGLIGFAVFAASYIAMALALIHDAGNFRDPVNMLSLTVLVMMLCFGVFSMFHEILYTRFVWFIFGLALAVPKMRPDQPAS
jgi:hypothetical protein